MLWLLSPVVAGAGLFWSCWGALRWRGGWRVAAAVPSTALAVYAAVVLVPDGIADPSSHNLLPFEVGVFTWPSLPYMVLVATLRDPPGWKEPG